MRTHFVRGLAALALVLLVGCTSTGTGTSDFSQGPGPSATPGDFGATPGGVKDMTFARELVEQGIVPPPEAFLVEAMFAEHDLPLDGAPCSQTFCTRAAMGIAPDESGASRGWLQVGLSSTIDPETYERPALALVFVVDVSGSMNWTYPNEGTTGAGIADALLRSLIAQLGEQDRAAFVAFDDREYDVLPPTPGSDQAALGDAIDVLAGTGGGGTSIEAGLSRGFEIAAGIDGFAGEVRVVLVTDAQPNVGATDPGSFQAMVSAGAAQGIGTTVFGTALGLGAEVFNAMAAERKGNAFTLMDTEDVGELMEKSWPWMFCPIAYDLTLTVRPDVLGIETEYGFPGEPESEAEVSLSVATIFLSRGRGALLLELAPETDGAIASANASVRVDYLDLAGRGVHDEISASYQGQAVDAEGRWFEQVGVAKTTALALLVSAMREAAELYGSDAAGAIAVLQPARDRFASDAAAIGDGAIDPELAFADALLALMNQGAEQGSAYPQ